MQTLLKKELEGKITWNLYDKTKLSRKHLTEQ